MKAVSQITGGEMEKKALNKEIGWIALEVAVKERSLSLIYELLKDIEQLESDTEKEIKE